MLDYLGRGPYGVHDDMEIICTRENLERFTHNMKPRRSPYGTNHGLNLSCGRPAIKRQSSIRDDSVTQNVESETKIVDFPRL